VTLPAPLDRVDAALRDHFGSDPLRASVSFVGVDPIEVLRFEPIPDDRAYVSLGMSRHPMTASTAAVHNTNGPRAELMLQLRDPLDERADVWRQLAVLAAAPAVEGVVYTPGMTVDLGSPLSSTTLCTGAVVCESPFPPVDAGLGQVDVLELLPATPNELAWSRVHGTTALRQRWHDQRIDLRDLGRATARLD
jgi:hypothetical protein